MLRKQILLWVFSGVGLVVSSGCVVPQPRGEGLYRHVQEPTTKAWYHLYLPVDYVRNRGRHPDPKMRRWPLVMTFHGMKPWDNARPQEREWEKEADIYGYIVCAPELETSSSLMEYPLTKEHGYVLRDRQRVLAIMRDVFAKCAADRKRVLSTSWSCGGYLAHYFVNRYPEKFSCIATRLSNFSPGLMIEDTVSRYKNKVPVAIFIGDGDFPACKTESENAVAWYRARNFDIVRGKMIDNMAHRRIPQVAAAFFAEQLGIEPLRPAEAARTLAQVQMVEYEPPQALIAKMSPRATAKETRLAAATRPSNRAAPPASRRAPGAPYHRTVVVECTRAGQNYPIDRTPPYDPLPEGRWTRTRGPKTRTDAGSERLALGQRSSNPRRPPTGDPRPPGRRDDAHKRARRGGSPRETSTPVRTAKRFNPRDTTPRAEGRHHKTNSQKGDRRSVGGSERWTRGAGVRRGTSAFAGPASKPRRVIVRLSDSTIGTPPHYIDYSVDLPREVLNGADFLWKDNGVWISDKPSDQKFLVSPGDHHITVLIVTKDDVEYRGSVKVQVLDPGPTGAARPSSLQ